jgi:hypothetical protein
MEVRREIEELGPCLAVTAALVVGTLNMPAWADTMPGLPWMSPAKITSGVPVQVASIAPCPPAPTPGDSVLVQVTLSFGSGGSASQVLAANPDGSWSGSVTFFSGVSIRQTTISAECVDFNGIFGVPYAQYHMRHTQVFNRPPRRRDGSRPVISA